MLNESDGTVRSASVKFLSDEIHGNKMRAKSWTAKSFFSGRKDPHSLSMPLVGEHDLVAFGVGTKGEVGRLARLVGHRFVAEGATGGDEFSGSREDIGDLEGQTGPGGFVLAAAVDSEGRAGDVELGEVFVLAGNFRAEEHGVESHSAGEVFGPDYVFEAFDGHLAEAVSQL